MKRPSVLLVMGVSGAGKTSVGKALAEALGWQFRDADEFHPQSNKDKMAHGIPLDDSDRAPWLAAIAQWIDSSHAMGEPAVVTCSALKRRYRDVVVGARDFVQLVYLRGDMSVLAERIGGRQGHFMPAALLESQLDTLEEPGEDENPVVVDVAQPVEAEVAAVLAETGLRAR
ncbi:gluconokinase [Roseomonas sp. NAR14]|uniref:Gluconokinase n=1 Tax=Roseomonas acroporae TaxID=2937791 RepID=A0A9X2BTW8_9PROT|nr:gluconokinase [Roseomonas acroporae]MCK8783596.1 gluconokinase [Roseomonas acroporae]